MLSSKDEILESSGSADTLAVNVGLPSSYTIRVFIISEHRCSKPDARVVSLAPQL